MAPRELTRLIKQAVAGDQKALTGLLAQPRTEKVLYRALGITQTPHESLEHVRREAKTRANFYRAPAIIVTQRVTKSRWTVLDVVEPD
jgi:hypothetical protein